METDSFGFERPQPPAALPRGNSQLSDGACSRLSTVGYIARTVVIRLISASYLRYTSVRHVRYR